ncbi:MAG: subclass B3 metallo-beta-lactamase [Oceanicoccus sp.]
MNQKVATTFKFGSLVLLLLISSVAISAQPAKQCIEGGWTPPKNWTTAYPAHQIIGPLYAVGGSDLSVFLIATEDGHILINSALKNSIGFIKENVESLGFKFNDIKVLLTMQAHFDHTADFAEIQKVTGAEVWATQDDARVLEDGGASDAHFGECIEFRFPPVNVDRILADQEVFTLGEIQIQTHYHPGHTEGSSSYSLTVRENDRDYNVVIANMGTINPGKKLVNEPTYPGVSGDFAATYQRQKLMDADVWVAAHASQYDRANKYKQGQAYDPDTFVDPEGFLAEVERLEAIYLEQVQAEKH